MRGYLPASMDVMSDRAGPLRLGPEHKALQDLSQRKQVCGLHSVFKFVCVDLFTQCL